MKQQPSDTLLANIVLLQALSEQLSGMGVGLDSVLTQTQLEILDKVFESIPIDDATAERAIHLVGNLIYEMTQRVLSEFARTEAH